VTTTRRPRVRYRVVVTELVDGHPTVVMDTVGAGFHAAVGDFDHDRLRGEHGIGGPLDLLEQLAQLIADHPTGSRSPGANQVRLALDGR
jgi:hypothetical protein